ncbi:L-arabinose isomerase [Halanaerobium sp. ST460_2HS_T2]|uniref:L-arabinose isomerase n=1 Tax=Halanaerobium sp. ST460_2HS_T2 TaxID=2183914 RepID=UPI000DF488AC|nr:L-arabinose isomerase [Halanaerobium sp. ST460_2HS_T2]RCW61908.1 L-arabinose isomerase [Halanaerobium sp. ST460_2HS_T2]
MKNIFEKQELWFVTGSQHLYGDSVLKEVEENSKKIAEGLSAAREIPVEIKFKSVVTTAEEIRKVVLEANSSDQCIGLITWMHTFSPAKMWIAGLKAMQKPLLHLHTQFNRDIPWDEIDMNFMNTNQAAHGGREYGFMVSRIGKNRKVVAGHWQDEEVQRRIGVWTRAAAAWADAQGAKFVRFGDNMRNVAVTEGDKVEAQMKFGYEVHYYGIGDLVEYIDAVDEAEIAELIEVYKQEYNVQKGLLEGEGKESLKESARIEIGLRKFLEEGNFKGFTTNFEDLHGMKQLPGLAVQRLMRDGYGFGGEGDWKTSALVRAMKVMGYGLEGGTSFMEFYTYHLDPKDTKVLGAHMLEVCESIADGKANLEMHPLGIGGKEDPARLVFDVASGPAVNATIIDMGNRFRLIVNEVKVEAPEHDMPELPVARVFWKAEPTLREAVESWIYAGGAHHTGFSKAVTTEHLRDFAEIADIELLTIDADTEVNDFKKELKWNDVYYKLK